MKTAPSGGRASFQPPRPSRLATALEVLTVAGCLALGPALVASVWRSPTAPAPATARSSPAPVAIR